MRQELSLRGQGSIMFSGLVEEIGRVSGVEPCGDSVRLTIVAHESVADVHSGDSIAVNGVCLTVTSFDEVSFSADVMRESLECSALGSLTVGSPVNVERAVKADARLGGHIMQGHVDGTAELISRTHTDHWDVLRFSLPDDLARYVVHKGSIAVNGTSLTVSALCSPDTPAGEHYFDVSLIPTTLKETILGQLEPGDLVNIEVDIVGKYVENMLAFKKGMDV